MQAACVDRLCDYLREQGVAHTVSHHAARYTAQELAQVEHVPGRLVAKVVVVLADGAPHMVVLPATMKVDTVSVEAETGAQYVRLAHENEFEHIFPDCEVGAMPPFGQLYGVPVLVDSALTRDPVILFNAGTHQDVITMSYVDFERLVKPRIGRFARVEAGAA
ncbi:MAG TPA: YbaK/EbsC family protein [bacterium]|nr:YbaK/EbsC family protein [bacterium]